MFFHKGPYKVRLTNRLCFVGPDSGQGGPGHVAPRNPLLVGPFKLARRGRSTVLAFLLGIEAALEEAQDNVAQFAH